VNTGDNARNEAPGGAAAPAKGTKTIDDLIAVMAALRTPVTGCPWDLEQTFATIAPYTLEEAYEVADAIARENLPDLKEELGDLLLQVVYHAQMAQEQGAFAFADVAHAITTKMIRRHPHVFGDGEARSAATAKGFWERIKAEEKAAKAAERQHAGTGTGSSGPSPSLLDDVPAGMPGLTRALKLQDKAAKVGFDWPALTNVFDKLHEELTELQEAIAAPADPNDATHRHAHIEEEFGDLLFVLANIGRHLRIDPEKALRGANQKFIRRFHHIEARLAAMGSSPLQSDLEQMDALWDEAKAIERTKKGSDPQV
jgi:ATP diphosphatase